MEYLQLKQRILFVSRNVLVSTKYWSNIPRTTNCTENLEKKYQLKLGYIEFAMTGVRHSAIVNPAGVLLLTRRVNNS